MRSYKLGPIIPTLTSWTTPLPRQATVNHIGVSRRQECLGRVIFLPDQSRHEDSESVAWSLPRSSMTHSLLSALLFSDVVFTGRTTIHFDESTSLSLPVTLDADIGSLPSLSPMMLHL